MNNYKSIKMASILGIIGNVFLLIIKLIIGLITTSQAMIADAFNSAGDIFSSFMTFIGNKIANIPRDDDHNLGHGKAEYIYSLLISLTMILLSFKIFIDSFLGIINKQKYLFSPWLVIVCFATIIIKLCLFIYTKIIYKKTKNILIKANSTDHRNDCIITFFNLVSCLLSLINIYWVDSVVGIGISIWIFYTSVKIFKDSYDVLMDKSISDEKKQEVLKIIKRHKEIKKTQHFNSTPIGYRYQISVTIFVDGNLSTFKSHKIADDLEKEIIKEIPEIYLALIHVNPIEIKHLEIKETK